MSFFHASLLLRTAAKHPKQPSPNGLTLPEVLVASVVLLIAIAGSIAAFNLITFAVTQTGRLANQNRIVDRDIALITDLNEVYGACAIATGSSNDALCPDSEPLQSFYYFPQNAANISAFESACEDGSLVNGFIANINGTGGQDEVVVPQTTGVVTRQPATRVGTGRNHLVEVSWEDVNERTIRTIHILPIVSSWCP